MDTFRTRVIEPEVEQTPEKPAEVTGIVKEKTETFTDTSNKLEEWETNGGKYGIEYLGIRELSKEFPYKMQFQTIDKYIKGELEERGYDKTTKGWQDMLGELEEQLGTKNLNAVERLRRITGYIQILQKINKAKKLKEKYTLHNTD